MCVTCLAYNHILLVDLVSAVRIKRIMETLTIWANGILVHAFPINTYFPSAVRPLCGPMGQDFLTPTRRADNRQDIHALFRLVETWLVSLSKDKWIPGPHINYTKWRATPSARSSHVVIHLTRGVHATEGAYRAA